MPTTWRIDAPLAVGNPGDKFYWMADFDESLHPRDDSGKFGAGGGGAAKPAKPVKAPKVAKAVSQADVEKKMAGLTQVNIKTQLTPPSTREQAAYHSSVAKTEANLSPVEHEAVGRYVGDDFAPMRRAALTGKPPDMVGHAQTMNDAMSRELKTATSIRLYRGMAVPPEVAHQLLTKNTVELKTTTSFSMHGEEAMSFAGVTGEGHVRNAIKNDGHIPVVLMGNIKAVGLPGSPESELVRPSSKLKITSRTVHVDPSGAKVLVLHVKDG